MPQTSSKERHVLEFMLIVVCLGLSCLLLIMQGYKMVILHLFFLPVVLGGFFLGRYRAGVMALFCVLSASLVVAFRLADFSADVAPLVIALAVTVWAAVLGLTALLVGTLSDERVRMLKELHEAYVGVVEVLSQYLQSAHPYLKARSICVAELSQQIAVAMKLSPRQVDDIRVAALLYDVGNIEVTTRVIRRAVDSVEADGGRAPEGKFQGMDLMLSLGAVLSGAVPLLLSQEETASAGETDKPAPSCDDAPVGAEIIRAVRAYIDQAQHSVGGKPPGSREIIRRLRQEEAPRHDPEVLEVLARVTSQSTGLGVLLAAADPVPAAQAGAPADL